MIAILYGKNTIMRIILSPAKKMNINTDSMISHGTPVFLEQTKEILAWLRSKSYQELKKIWACNDKIAEQNYTRIREMDLDHCLTPALLSYDGLAFQYMAPVVFEESQFTYVQTHLRILSGFYGVIKPMDGVTPYRLEMQARVSIGNHKNLYDLWGSRLYQEVRDESGIIINLASKEYSKCIEKYLTGKDTCITCTFAEMNKGKLVTKGTYAKMARGEMVRYMAEHQIEDPNEIKHFDRLNFKYREDLSSATDYVFEKCDRGT